MLPLLRMHTISLNVCKTVNIHVHQRLSLNALTCVWKQKCPCNSCKHTESWYAACLGFILSTAQGVVDFLSLSSSTVTKPQWNTSDQTEECTTHYVCAKGSTSTTQNQTADQSEYYRASVSSDTSLHVADASTQLDELAMPPRKPDHLSPGGFACCQD